MDDEAIVAEERNALLEIRVEEEQDDSPPAEEAFYSGDPIQSLLTALGRFQRQVSMADKGAAQAAWPDECMEQLIAGIEVAYGQDWPNVQEAMTDAARILQSCENAGRAEWCLGFLQDSYEILCLMVGDLIVDNVRSGVIEKWRQRYRRAEEDLAKAGIPLIEDEREERSEAEERRVPEEREEAFFAEPEAPAGDFVYAALNDDEDPLPEPEYEELPASFESPAEPFAATEESEEAVLEEEPVEQEEEVFEEEAIAEFATPFDLPPDPDAERLAEPSGLPTLDALISEDVPGRNGSGTKKPVFPQAENLELSLWAEPESEPAPVPIAPAENTGTPSADLDARPVLLEPEWERGAEPEAAPEPVTPAEPELYAEEAQQPELSWESAREETDAPLEPEPELAPEPESAAEMSVEAVPVPEMEAEAEPEPTAAIELEPEPEPEAELETATELEAETESVHFVEDIAADSPGETPVPEIAPAAEDDPAAALLRSAQAAMARGDVADAKMTALRLAAAIARIEVATFEDRLDDANHLLKSDDESIRKAVEQVREAEQRVQSMESQIAERENEFQSQRVHMGALREQVADVEQAVAELEAQIRALQAQRDTELERLRDLRGQMDEAAATESRIQTDLDGLGEAEQTARDTLEECRQYVVQIQGDRKAHAGEIEVVEAELEQRRKSMADIERTIALVGGEPARTEPDKEDGLLF